MATLAEKRAEGPDLFRAAFEVAFGPTGAELAALASAAGNVEAADELSPDQRRMLSIGTLSGAAAAIAMARHPFDHPQDALERTDAALDHAREVEARNREGQPLFEKAGGE
jgi:hypothetical protein